MKILTLIAVMFFSQNGLFAQETAKVENVSELTSVKENGSCVITLPSGITNEMVESNANFYTHYFTVQFDEVSKKSIITMVQNDERSRAVIIRFLAACNVDQVDVSGVLVKRDDLFLKYLK
jgi:hypothetical protein